MKRIHLLIICSIAILFGSVGLQAKQADQQFQGGGPLLAKGGGVGPFYGNETGSNIWYGEGAGASITTGTYNSFFGQNAGNKTSGGAYPAATSNSFFGAGAGQANTQGYWNSFFGALAGRANTTGHTNSFFGVGAGYSNTTGPRNSFFGMNAGQANTEGRDNSFFGTAAGYANTTGFAGSFFGVGAGYANTTGFAGSFFGDHAGFSNTTGTWNSFFGMDAGRTNTEGRDNSFFGTAAGHANTTGIANSFFGTATGYSNTKGQFNSFFGDHAGFSNTIENANSFIGASSDGSAGITNATAIGYRAKVTQSNSLILGSIEGVNGAYSDTRVGIGTTEPAYKLDVSGDDYVGIRAISSSVNGAELVLQSSTQAWYEYVQDRDLRFWDTTDRVTIQAGGNVGIGTTNPTERLQVVGNLKVSGQILYGSPEIEVPDYVFQSDYQLMSIQELERFISQEKHLPNMPNAGEIKEKGLNLSEFQMKLLEKIEELTLYTVQQAKTINEQRERLLTLEQAVARLAKHGEQK